MRSVRRLVERIQDNQLTLAASMEFSDRLFVEFFLTNQPKVFQESYDRSTLVWSAADRVGVYLRMISGCKKNLTFNAGVRMKSRRCPVKRITGFSNLRNSPDAQFYVGSPFFMNPTLRNFEPRVGVRLDPSGGRYFGSRRIRIFDVLPLPTNFSISFQHAVPFVQEVFETSFLPAHFRRRIQQLTTGLTSSRSVYVEHARSAIT